MQIGKIPVLIGLIMLLGTGTAGAWSINDDYDSQAIGSSCGVFWGGTSNSTVSSGNSTSGSKSCKMSVDQGQQGWGGGFVLPGTLQKGDEFWMRFRLFVPAGFDYNVSSGGDSLKFIRLAVKDTADVTSFIDWKWENDYKSSAYASIIQRNTCTTNCWQLFGGSSERPQRGVWETYEIYVKADNVPVDSGGQGRIRAWKNGVLIGDLTANRTLNNPTDFIKSALIFSYWNGGSPKTQFMYMDDLVATNVRPSAKDIHGNSYIGTGGFISIAPPLPPGSIS